MTILGTNNLRTSDEYAAVINNGDGDEKLDIMSPLGDIIINGGSINAEAGYGAAIGIGDGDYSTKYNSSLNSVGEIIINGGRNGSVNGDIEKTIVINGKKYSGEAKIIFSDG